MKYSKSDPMIGWPKIIVQRKTCGPVLLKGSLEGIAHPWTRTSQSICMLLLGPRAAKQTKHSWHRHSLHQIDRLGFGSDPGRKKTGGKRMNVGGNGSGARHTAHSLPSSMTWLMLHAVFCLLRSVCSLGRPHLSPSTSPSFPRPRLGSRTTTHATRTAAAPPPRRRRVAVPPPRRRVLVVGGGAAAIPPATERRLPQRVGCDGTNRRAAHPAPNENHPPPSKRTAPPATAATAALPPRHRVAPPPRRRATAAPPRRRGRRRCGGDPAKGGAAATAACRVRRHQAPHCSFPPPKRRGGDAAGSDAAAPAACHIWRQQPPRRGHPRHNHHLHPTKERPPPPPHQHLLRRCAAAALPRRRRVAVSPPRRRVAGASPRRPRVAVPSPGRLALVVSGNLAAIPLAAARRPLSAARSES